MNNKFNTNFDSMNNFFHQSEELPLKRRFVNKKECLNQNIVYLRRIIKAVKEGIDKAEEFISVSDFRVYIRNYMAVHFNQYIVDSLDKEFTNESLFMKYGRFVVRANHYQYLVKKLNRYDMPMGIRTKNQLSINNQWQQNLFKSDASFEATIEPILYIGYKINKFGSVGDIKIVYINNDALQWVISEDEILNVSEIHNETKKNSKLKFRKRNSHDGDSIVL